MNLQVSSMFRTTMSFLNNKIAGPNVGNRISRRYSSQIAERRWPNRRLSSYLPMASVKTERASMKERRLPLKSGVSTGVLLVAPAMVLLLFGFASPLGTLLVESLKEFTPGRVGSVDNAAFTLASYAE